MLKRVKKLLWVGLTFLLLLIFLFLPSIWGNLIYPLDYRDAITSASIEFNLPPTLIAGLIFTESRFNPNATSRVGARGLAQIMPATGAGIARNLGDPNYTPDKLYDPPTAVRYGSYYIRNLLDRYNNDLDVALASYNGGPGVASRFQATRDLKLIPLETAGFINKVKRHRDIYASLYGEDLGSNIGERLTAQEPLTLWDRIFGRLFGRFSE